MTMPRSLFWVEPTEIASTIERLRGSRSTEGPARPTSTVPFARESAAVAAVPTPGGPSLAEQDGPLPTGALEERLVALLAWVHDISDAVYVFVVDQDGLGVVHDTGAPLEMLAAAGTLTETWETLRQRFGWTETNRLAAEIASHEWLHLSGQTTPWGLFSLGVVVRNPLPKSLLVRIHQRFEQTLI